MKQIAWITAALTIATLGNASAAQTAINNLPNEGAVSIQGTVKEVTNERAFVLTDSTGEISVDIESDQSVVLKAGDTVTVKGSIDKGIMSKDINATTVLVHKGATEAAKDMVEAHSSASLEGATTFNINNLPKEGLVKISGKVSDVDNEESFTLKDASGSISVNIKGVEKAAFTEGAEATVIGYVNTGLLSKTIDAKKILVISSNSLVPNPEE